MFSLNQYLETKIKENALNLMESMTTLDNRRIISGGARLGHQQKHHHHVRKLAGLDQLTIVSHQ